MPEEKVILSIEYRRKFAKNVIHKINCHQNTGANKLNYFSNMSPIHGFLHSHSLELKLWYRTCDNLNIPIISLKMHDIL